MAFVLPLWKTIGPNGHRTSGTMTLNPNWGGVIELGGEARAAVLCVSSCFNRDYCFLFARVRDPLYILQLNNLMLRGIRASVPRILICFQVDVEVVPVIGLRD